MNKYYSMEALTEEDKSHITSRLNDFRVHPFPSCEKFLTPWAKAKDNLLINAFEGKLIIEDTIQVNPNIERESVAEELWDKYNWFTIVDRIWYWLNVDYEISPKFEYKDLFNCKVFALNEIPFSFRLTRNLGNSENHSINKGMKLSRFLSKICIPMLERHGYSAYTVTDFIQQLSQINNHKASEIDVTLSIHPMDYMTMSDNDSGWESCMSWDYDGEFRAGTLEMCNSSCVVVAYVKGHESENCVWNNKSWRELFIVTPELIMGIKGYPYRSVRIETFVLNKLKGMMEKLGYQYQDAITELKNPKRGYSFNAEDGASKTITVMSNLMYNDCYMDHQGYLLKDTNSLPRYTDIDYSGVAYCIETGETISQDFADTLLYPELRGYIKCPDCGYWYYGEDEDVFEFEGKYYCRDCSRNHFITCQVCDRMIAGNFYDLAEKTDIDEDLVMIKLKYETAVICKDCFESDIAEMTEDEKSGLFEIMLNKTGNNVYKCNYSIGAWMFDNYSLRELLYKCINHYFSKEKTDI